MTERVKKQLDLLNARAYRARRVAPAIDPKAAEAQWDHHTEAGDAARFVYACACEKEAVFHGEDLFGFNRYCTGALANGRFGNVVVDYPGILQNGLCAIVEQAKALRPMADDEAARYYDGIVTCYEAAFGLVDMYEQAARAAGNLRLANALLQVPRRGARDYYEALIVLRFISYILRLNRCVHLPLGRFDVYMKPYYEAFKQKYLNI